MGSMTVWPKEAGPKPTKKLLAEASNYARTGTADHLVVAMALRPNGLTQQEVISAVKHPHRNKIRQLVRDKHVKQYQLPDSSRSIRVRLVPRQ